MVGFVPGSTDSGPCGSGVSVWVGDARSLIPLWKEAGARGLDSPCGCVRLVDL